MRGTIGFERLSCSNKKYVRIVLNDAVYRMSIQLPFSPITSTDINSGTILPEWPWKVLPS